MSPVSTGQDLLNKLTPIPVKQVVAISMRGVAVVEAVEPFVLSELRIQDQPQGFPVGYRGSFGVLNETPLDQALIKLQPLRESILLLYQNFYGIFKPDEKISLSKEIKTGERLLPLDNQFVIVIEGKFGLVTLQSGASGECADAIAKLEEEVNYLHRENTALRQQLGEVPGLRLLIDRLKDTLAARDNEILELKARITQIIEESKRTPDDFATAVSDSVNKLQTRLSNMTNKISDFVVREFDLEAKVYIDVNPQGEIDYRFIHPGDNVDPQKVSNLTIKLMPVPKQESPIQDLVPTPEPQMRAGPGGAQLPGHDIPMEHLAGDDSDVRDRLRRNQINTVADFLQVATRARTLVALSTMLDIDRQRLGNWVMQAQLMTIKGISAAMAQLLIDIGMTSLQAIAGADANALLAQVAPRAAGQSLPVPALDEVQRWIATAKLFIGT